MTYERVATFADVLPDIRSDGVRLSPLQRNIFTAVAYRDIFQFAPSVTEIHRYLPFASATREQVEAALGAGDLVPGFLATDGSHYALRGREAFFALRNQRRLYSARLMKKACITAARLASLPFIEMIALTGSLAAENPDEEADIDLIIVTSADRLWRVNAMTSVLRFVDQKLGPRHFCPNVMRTTQALEFESRRLYTAQEMGMMVPLYGYHRYLEIFERNSWMFKFLPNCTPYAEPANIVSAPAAPGTRRLLESIFASPLGNLLETTWYKRRTRQCNNPDHLFSKYTPFTHQRQGLFLGMGDTIEHALDCRLASAGLPPATLPEAGAGSTPPAGHGTDFPRRETTNDTPGTEDARPTVPPTR